MIQEFSMELNWINGANGQICWLSIDALNYVCCTIISYAGERRPVVLLGKRTVQSQRLWSGMSVTSLSCRVFAVSPRCCFQIRHKHHDHIQEIKLKAATDRLASGGAFESVENASSLKAERWSASTPLPHFKCHRSPRIKVTSPSRKLKGQFTVLKQQFHEERGVDNLSRWWRRGRWLHLWLDFHSSSSYSRAWEQREEEALINDKKDEGMRSASWTVWGAPIKQLQQKVSWV